MAGLVLHNLTGRRFPTTTEFRGCKMRIVMLGTKGLPRISAIGGVERGVLEMGQRLVSLGHEVIVYERARSFGTRMEDGIIVRSVPFVDWKTLAGWSHIALSLVDSLLR